MPNHKFSLEQACDFSGFYWNSGFLKFLLSENPFLRFTYKQVENWEWDLLFTFVLLNRGIPDVETILYQ